MEILLLAMILGIIPAAIARGKGRSFFLWWLFGAALFIIALPVAILIESKGDATARRQMVRQEVVRSEFVADGALKGIPYRQEKGGQITALANGSLLKFKSMDAFQQFADNG